MDNHTYKTINHAIAALEGLIMYCRETSPADSNFNELQTRIKVIRVMLEELRDYEEGN